MYYNIFILALFTFIVLFFSIFFRYNALFNCTSNNILLTIGIICSLFLGPDEQCKILNVRLQCGQWQETQRQGCYMLLGQPISHPNEIRFNQIRCEKSNKRQLSLLCFGDAGERGTCESFLNLKYFIQAAKFRSSCGPLISHHSPVAPQKIWCGPLWGHTARIENHCYRKCPKH